MEMGRTRYIFYEKQRQTNASAKKNEINTIVPVLKTTEHKNHYSFVLLYQHVLN